MKAEARFALTSEAFLNNGVAFAFTWVAITIGMVVSGGKAGFLQWFAYRIATGVYLIERWYYSFIISDDLCTYGNRFLKLIYTTEINEYKTVFLG